MKGVVLSGGESRRMETDKGLLLAENKSWVQTAYDKLSTILPQVVISINRSQYEVYAGQFANGELVPDNNSIKVNGPLHCLLSVHVQFPGDDLLVLACDIVGMHPLVLSNLLQTFNEHPGHDCYTFKNDNGYQPLAGIYTSKILSEILQQAESGELIKFSMKHVIDTTDTYTMNVPADWNKYFANYNYKEDIDFQ